jgi:hypothetical protein
MVRIGLNKFADARRWSESAGWNKFVDARRCKAMHGDGPNRFEQICRMNVVKALNQARTDLNKMVHNQTG